MPGIGATSPGVAGLAMAVGLGCVAVLVMAIGPWIATGRTVIEFVPVDEVYYPVADRVSRGEVPYRDFPLEYPLGSVPQLVLPILAGRSMPAYKVAYSVEMLAVNALLVLAVAAYVERREGRAAVPRRLIWYLACYLFLCRLIVSRLDVVPALLAFAAAAAWSGDRPVRGGGLAALGALVKVFPGLALVPAGLREVARWRETRLRGSIAFGVVSALGLAAWYLVAGPGLAGSIRFHQERGLEVESLYAGILAVAGRLLGEPLSVAMGHGSIELQSAWSPATVAASRYVQLFALVLTVVLFLRSRGRSVLQCTGALLLAFMVTAPVLSPQYLIWVLPFVVALAGPLGRRARPLYVVCCAFTFLIYPVLFHRGLLPLRMPTLLLLNLRNLLLVALWALLAFGIEGDRGEDLGAASG
jgi:hypothetical protein